MDRLVKLILILVIFLPFYSSSKKNEYVKGVDISHHQGVINWSKSDKKLFSFVYIKSTEAAKFKDPLFKHNWNGAKGVGIYVGAYHVYNFKISGRSQAMNFINTVPKYKNSLPPAIDLHLISSVTNEEKSKMIKELKIFNKLLLNHYGKNPIFYICNSQHKKYLLGHFNNPVWTWHYTEKTKPSKFGNKSWTMWQYGIAGKSNTKYKKFTKNFGLDVDYYNGTMKDFLKLIKG